MSNTSDKSSPSEPQGIQRIIVGLDLLSDSTDALDKALSFATLMPRTHVEVVWVPPIAYMAAADTSEVTPHQLLDRRVKACIEKFGPDKLFAAEVSVQTTLGEGRPAQSLSRIAFMREAHLIIVGSHDKASSLERFLLGSTAKKLVQIAPCPVLVERPLTADAVPDIAEPLGESQARRRIGLPHRYRSAGRNVQARENMPLLFPMEGS